MIDDFIALRRQRWEKLESLVSRARTGQRLSADEVEELGCLYRQATSDFAVALRDFPRDRVTGYLRQLVGRAHAVVYRRTTSDWGGIVTYFLVTFPRAFRAAAGYTALAFALFALPCLVAFLATQVDPLAGRIILPASPLVDQIEHGQSWLDVDEARRSMMASLIMTNNIQVAFLAFAGGAFLGLGSVYVLVYNGLILGAVLGLASAHGLGPTVGSFVVVHGEIELTVVFIAGGAGLRLGHALLAPGLLPRSIALARNARQAIVLVIGCVPMLAIAGLLEGFVSPSELPSADKVVIGFVATVTLYTYLLAAGRSQRVGMRPAGTDKRDMMA